MEMGADSEKIRKNPTIGRILILSLVIGLAVRFALIPLTYEYDMYHWAVVLQNINSGDGLYSLDGYFYTPVWGYILGAMDAVWNNLLSVDVFGMKVSELLGVQTMEHMNHTATVTTLEFNAFVKLMLIAVDVVVGFAVRSFVRSLTNDERKADMGFALWFLCPIAIYMSAIQGMFDNISGLLTLLSIVLVLREHYLPGGFVLASAILLKLYPAFALPVIIALILVRHGCTKRCLKDMACLFAGGLSAFAVIMAPTVMDGTFTKAFTFITDRAANTNSFDMAFGYLSIAIGVAIMLFFTALMLRSNREDANRDFIKYAMLALVGGVVCNLGPQYPLVVIPLLCAYVAAMDRTYFICWLLIGAGCALQALVLNNYSLLMPLASYGGWIGFDTVLSGLEWTEAYIIGAASFRSLMNTVFSMVSLAGLFLCVLFCHQDRIASRFPRIGGALTGLRSIGSGGAGHE